MKQEVIASGDGWMVSRWEDGTVTLGVPCEDGVDCVVTSDAKAKFVRIASEDESIGFQKVPMEAFLNFLSVAVAQGASLK